MTDVEIAKIKAAKIREEGQLKYNLKLLNELEADKARKLTVVNILLLICLAIVGIVYSFFEQTFWESLDDFIIKLFA